MSINDDSPTAYSSLSKGTVKPSVGESAVVIVIAGSLPRTLSRVRKSPNGQQHAFMSRRILENFTCATGILGGAS